MDVFRFVLPTDPHSTPRLGARLDDATVVDLQAAHFSMRERPSPWLRDHESFATGGEEARRVAEQVVGWVATERPPGTTAPASRVRVLEDAAAPAASTRGPGNGEAAGTIRET